MKSNAEFIALTALLISIVALGIDAMLPALPQIGADLGVVHDNDRQWVLSIFVLGLGIGQLFYGPVSDSLGRKPMIIGGLVLFMAGSVLSLIAANFTTMMIGRLLQGLGAAGPRTVIIAMVRDQYAGRAMARIMSFVMTVFILVPILAPALGQLIVHFAHWRVIFVFFLLITMISAVWFHLRQVETLKPDARQTLAFVPLLQRAVSVFKNRIALGYLLATSLIFSAFFGYLVSAQQIFHDIFGLTHLFPLYFALLAIALGIATLTNARLVMRYGMTRLVVISQTVIVAASGIYGLLLWADLATSLAAFMLFFSVIFFAIGIMFGNINALAMEPLGHIAGTAAAIIGSFTTIISVTLGGLIGYSFNGTLMPLLAGFIVFGGLALLAIRWAEHARREDAVK